MSMFEALSCRARRGRGISRGTGSTGAALAALAIALSPAAPAIALPTAPGLFCATYAESPLCRGSLPACALCHSAPPELHPFGQAVNGALMPATRPLPPDQFAAGLAGALRAIEAQDADGDGTSNLDEIRGGTFPGNADSKPTVQACPPDKRNPAYDVCFYDRAYVFKKVHLDFCARSPTAADMRRFRALSLAEQEAAIHAQLDTCLASEAWLAKDGIVWSMAHPKVKPIQAIKSGTGAGQIPLGDYDDDYALFVWAHTGDRDVRRLLTAQTFAERRGGSGGRGTNYVEQAEMPGAQSVEASRRAGMITTKWFLVLNVMFTPLPRTAAAQAYRAYLGLDIGKLEGIQPVANEPVDYDRKGVRDPACSGCHSTLDPLTYPFAKYDGLNRFPFGTYVSNRQRSVPETGVIFGQPVADLVEWAQVASNSEAFAKSVVNDYWHLLFGAGPRPEELGEFEQLWRGLMTTHQYRVQRMLHALVSTEAYGVP